MFMYVEKNSKHEMIQKITSTKPNNNNIIIIVISMNEDWLRKYVYMDTNT